MQEVLLEALEKINTGWFERAPHLSLQAQMRDLLVWGLLHVKTRILRERVRTGTIGILTSAGGELQDADPFELIPDRGASPDDWAHANELLAAVRQVGSPRRRLLLFMLQYPHLVGRRDIDAAAAETAGGGALARTPEQIWAMWLNLLSTPDARRFAATWKLLVVELLYFDGPPGTASEADVRARANGAEQTLSRARRDVRARLEGGYR